MNQMYEFLKPPTDNIYKFMAIFGLVLLVLLFTGKYILIRNLEVQYIQTEGEFNKLNLEINYIEEDVIKAENSVDSLTQEQIKDLRDRLIQSSYKNADLETKTKLLQYYSDEIDVLHRFGYIGISISVLLMVSGFWFWYFKWQRPQDLIIFSETQKSKKKISR